MPLVATQPEVARGCPAAQSPPHPRRGDRRRRVAHPRPADGASARPAIPLARRAVKGKLRPGGRRRSLLRPPPRSPPCRCCPRHRRDPSLSGRRAGAHSPPAAAAAAAPGPARRAAGGGLNGGAAVRAAVSGARGGGEGSPRPWRRGAARPSPALPCPAPPGPRRLHTPSRSPPGCGGPGGRGASGRDAAAAARRGRERGRCRDPLRLSRPGLGRWGPCPGEGPASVRALPDSGLQQFSLRFTWPRGKRSWPSLRS